MQRQDILPQFDSPVFIICPDPPFKTSYFKNLGIEEDSMSGENVIFWMFPGYESIIQNDSFIAIDAYMSMSYQLGVDLKIYALQYQR